MASEATRTGAIANPLWTFSRAYWTTSLANSPIIPAATRQFSRIRLPVPAPSLVFPSPGKGDHAPIRVPHAGVVPGAAARGRPKPRAFPRAGELSRQRAAPDGRRAGAPLQRPRRRMAGQPSLRPQGRRVGGAGTDPSADGCRRSRISVRSAQARAARLHGAEGRGNGRLAARSPAPPPPPNQAPEPPTDA